MPINNFSTRRGNQAFKENDMQVKLYDETDVVESPDPNEHYPPFQFIVDVVGDNSDLFDEWDNQVLQEHLLDRVGVPGDTRPKIAFSSRTSKTKQRAGSLSIG
jgi:hypothetical protein